MKPDSLRKEMKLSETWQTSTMVTFEGFAQTKKVCAMFLRVYNSAQDLRTILVLVLGHHWTLGEELADRNHLTLLRVVSPPSPLLAILKTGQPRVRAGCDIGRIRGRTALVKPCCG